MKTPTVHHGDKKFMNTLNNLRKYLKRIFLGKHFMKEIL